MLFAREVLAPLLLTGVIGLTLVGFTLEPSAPNGGRDAPFALYHGEWNGNDSEVEGTLVLEGDCLYIETGYNGWRPYLAFAARNTWWDPQLGAVRIGGHIVRPGDHVQFGGSGRAVPPPPRSGWALAPHPSCDTSEVWFAGEP